MNKIKTISFPKRRFLLVLPFVVAAMAVFIWKTKNVATIAYHEVAVERGNLTLSILATGTVQPENRLEIKPPIAGRIERVLIKEGQKVAKSQILAWMSSTERAALLDAARSRGDDELKRWEDLYRPTPVIAPIAGTIILRNVESGQTFTSTDSILVMADRLTVKAQVDETDIAQIKLKQSAQIILDAYPDSKIPGKVDQVAFEAKTVNNVTTYTVDILPESTPPFMRSGMTANVTFALDSRKNVLLVPNDAIKAEAGKNLVLMRVGENKSEPREITTGITDGKKTEITAGLSEGEKILSAQITVRDGKSRATGGTSPFGSPGGRPRGSGRGGSH